LLGGVKLSKEKVLEELTELIRGNQMVLNDPMNGCPEDFAEDFAPVEAKKCLEAELAGATYGEITIAIAEGHRRAEKDLKELFGGVS